MPKNGRWDLFRHLKGQNNIYVHSGLELHYVLIYDTSKNFFFFLWGGGIYYCHSETVFLEDCTFRMNQMRRLMEVRFVQNDSCELCK